MTTGVYVFILSVGTYSGVLYWAWKKGKDGLYK